MGNKPPAKSSGRRVVETAAVAGASLVPVAGGPLSVVLATMLGWKLDERRERWLGDLADAVDELGERVDGLSVESLVDDPRFVDAVVSATATVQHTHDEEKIGALRNAVLNSVADDAPDADTQAILLGLADRLTASHLRFLTLWNDPPAWFAAHELPPPRPGQVSSRIHTAEVGMAELRGRQDFIRLLSYDLTNAGLMTADIGGMVSGSAVMDRLTSELGTQLVRFVSTPAALAGGSSGQAGRSAGG